MSDNPTLVERPEETAVRIEKKLCSILQREWTETGISVETLAEDAVDRIEALERELAERTRERDESDAVAVEAKRLLVGWCFAETPETLRAMGALSHEFFGRASRPSASDQGKE